MKKTLLLLAALLTAMTAWSQSTFTVSNSNNEFTITRSNPISTELVVYRTVSISAIAGTHFTEAIGSLYFEDGETQKKVTVTEGVNSNALLAYRFQTGTTRTYRFEVLDLAGFLLAYKDRNITYTSDYQHISNYVNKSVTDLVYFDNNGNIKSGDGNHYLDVSYSPSSWTKVTDAGYKQAVHTVSTDNLYHGSSLLRTYLNSLNNKMYATVYFTQKEEKDGYQYIQILADNISDYDGNDPDGAVNDPSTSLYKACFELSYTSDYITDSHHQFFPHRYDYVNKADETGAGLNRYAFDDNNSYLYEQKYQSPSYNAANTGSLSLATTVNALNIRFDAAGKNDDDWDFRDLKVRLALVDATAPSVLDDYQASGGRHSKGNTIYVSVPFNEIVSVGNAPMLDTNWGKFNYLSGSGSNVLTFSGIISDDASGNFKVNSFSGTIADLAGNICTDNISHNFNNISLDPSFNFSIFYHLGAGALPPGQSNPISFNYETPTFTLINPILLGYDFLGWTGSNGTQPQDTITIEKGSTGDRDYTANWSIIYYDIQYDLAGGSLPVGGVNPSIYTVHSPDFTLTNPVRPGYDFLGWTGSNGTEPQDTVTIYQGSTGDLNFKANFSLMRGNVNGDGGVNIADVTSLIDYLLSGDTSNIYLSVADCNRDGNVNIADVTSLIDYLLSGSW